MKEIEKGDMGYTEISCDTGNVRNKDDMRHRGMTRMTRKTKESDGKKETHEVK